MGLFFFKLVLSEKIMEYSSLARFLSFEDFISRRSLWEKYWKKRGATKSTRNTRSGLGVQDVYFFLNQTVVPTGQHDP